MHIKRDSIRQCYFFNEVLSRHQILDLFFLAEKLIRIWEVLRTRAYLVSHKSQKKLIGTPDGINENNDHRGKEHRSGKDRKIFL